MSAAMTRTRPADRTLRFIIFLLARWTCPNNRPTYPTQELSADRNGKIFYASIASLSHISKAARIIPNIPILHNDILQAGR